MPFDKLVAPVCPEAKLRRLVKNMLYVGVVDALLGIEVAESEKALVKQFGKKKKAAELNAAAVLGAPIGAALLPSSGVSAKLAGFA